MKPAPLFFRSLAVLALATSAQAQSGQKPIISSELSGREITFLHKANEHGLVLVYLGDLAKSKGGSEAVRALGELISTTQTKELDQLLGLALTKGINFPPNPDILARYKKMFESLEKDGFDKVWLFEMANVLKASIQNYSSVQNASDADIKKFAESGLQLANQKLEVLNKVSSR